MSLLESEVNSQIPLICKRYLIAEEFWQAVAPQLKEYESQNAMCLGIANGFRKDASGISLTQKDPIYLGAVWQGNKLLGALVATWYEDRRSLIPSFITDLNIARMVFKDFLALKINASHVVAPVVTAKLYEALLSETGRKSKIELLMALYRCEKVVWPQISSGVHFRKAVTKDIPQIAKWVSDFMAEAVPNDPPIDTLKHAESKVSKGMFFVVEKEGELLSMAGWGRDLETSAAVNAVYTPKHLRGKGYASHVVAALTQRMLDAGKREVSLFADQTNPTSNKIYQNIGYEFVCESVNLKFE